jgi:hypothetical protein
VREAWLVDRENRPLDTEPDPRTAARADVSHGPYGHAGEVRGTTMADPD